MLDSLRTRLAHLIVRWLPGPRDLLVRAWSWLVVEASDLEGQRRCLEQVRARPTPGSGHMSMITLCFREEW